MHKEGSCDSNAAFSRVFVSRFGVNQWHEDFGDRRVDEAYVSHAVLGASLTMWHGVGRGLSWGGIVLDDANGCGIIVIGRSGHVVLLCGGMLV